MKEIDCCGLACPAPVLKVKEAIEKGGLNEIAVIVDNEAAKQNVSRFLGTRNFAVSVNEEAGRFYISGSVEGDTPGDDETTEMAKKSDQKIMVMVTSNTIGHGDDELGQKLMISFLKTLKEMGDDLWRLVFVNNGVKLTIRDSEVLGDLKDLEKAGVHILVCGTCLMHFNLLEQKQAGETTNMLDIVTAMQLADKVVNV